MADNRVQLLVSQAVPAALCRFWFNVLLHFWRQKNLSYWYLFCIYAFCRPRVTVHFASFLPASFPFPSVYCYVLYLPRYFVLYLRFLYFPLPFISSLPILSSQLFAFRALVLHSLHAYSNVLLIM